MSVTAYDFPAAAAQRRTAIRRATKSLAYRFGYGRIAALTFARVAVIAARPGEPPQVVAARVVPPKSASAMVGVGA